MLRTSNLALPPPGHRPLSNVLAGSNGGGRSSQGGASSAGSNGGGRSSQGGGTGGRAASSNPSSMTGVQVVEGFQNVPGDLGMPQPPGAQSPASASGVAPVFLAGGGGRGAGADAARGAGAPVARGAGADAARAGAPVARGAGADAFDALMEPSRQEKARKEVEMARAKEASSS